MPQTNYENVEPKNTGDQPLDENWANKLKKQVDESNKFLSKFRKSRENLIRRYVGDHYGNVSQHESVKKDPLNMVKMSAQIYLPLLVMHAPRYRVRTAKQTQKGTAWLVQEDLNETVKEVMFRNALEKAVVNSLYSFGVVKTGYSHGPQVPLGELFGNLPEEVAQETIEIPELFISSISPDDYLIDPFAKDLDEIQWEGDIYTVPYELANAWFPDAGLEKESYSSKKKGAAKISQTNDSPKSRLFPTVDLCDIYVPMYDVVWTFAPDQSNKGILNEAPWVGGRQGPYHKLWYYHVPDQVMPAAPAEAWVSLHDMLNDLARSVRDKVQRQKTVGTYGINNQQDGRNLQEARDGDFVAVQNPEAINQVELGGRVDMLENTLARFMNIFSQQAGNTDLLGGMSANARSATEAQMLGQNATVRVQDMQTRVERFAGRIGETIAKLRWQDPFAERELAYTVDLPNGRVETTTRYHSETKRGRIEDYKLEVVPYSMRGRNPQDYSRKLMEWWNNVLLPVAEIAAQQGKMPDAESFVNFMAEEMGIDQHGWFFRRSGAVQGGDGPGQERGPTRAEKEGGPAGRMSDRESGGRPDVMSPEARAQMEHKEVE